ncbi:hypothetical protein [Microbacterium sp. gxy059]|uniref:hypothetical protein n=1 Tax=Microbacterium sp. gxy059 TaxID=2957199 RepID=UPI003D9553E2
MATEWRNRRGKSVWQPTLPDGRRLWRIYVWGDPDSPQWGWRGEERDAPFLSGKRRAERIERRQMRREERDEMDRTFKEVHRG